MTSDLDRQLRELPADSSTILVTTVTDIAEVARTTQESGTARNARILLLVARNELDALHRIPVGPNVIGYVSRDALTPADLTDALAQVAAGGVPMPPWLAEQLLSVWRTTPRTVRPAPRLTPREQEALVLLVDGFSNKQIGRRLNISDHGAKRLVGNILAKLDCPNRTSVATLALRDGLYDQCLQNARPLTR
ncbi:response regulator transcription factor [Streptomyces sp. MZ04]|uniref:LuxR C-terminal-related transcriptional regulator n=1 Tax=Streptomyces sp. MZ04 TaxID=2559236 RepID=UPI00107E7BB5|nr:response regulator transcription factor [Streptomyces sp. MZ04]TGB08485.1 response regulator transcription factor [Streptomyces sp. MZ04]